MLPFQNYFNKALNEIESYLTVSCPKVKSHDLLSYWRRSEYSLRHPNQPHIHPRMTWTSSRLGLLYALLWLSENYGQPGTVC